MCVSDAYAGQKRVLSLLKLESSMLVTCHVAAKNGTQVLWKSSQYHYPLMHLSSPSAAFFFKSNSFLPSISDPQSTLGLPSPPCNCAATAAVSQSPGNW